MKLINRHQLEQLLKILKEDYGIEDINIDDFLFFLNKEGKIYITNKDIEKFIKKINFFNCGLYVIKLEKNKLRFSIEGSQIFGPLAKKRVVNVDLENVFHISKEMKKITLDLDNGFYIVKSNNDFAGSLFVKNKEIKDYIPKERKIYVDGTCINEGNI